MKAKKSLGQHFLTDRSVIDQIIEQIKTRCDLSMPLLEVGPGRGALTFELAKSYKSFAAFELDRDMIEHLKANTEGVQIINEDFLKADFDQLFDQKAFNLVGNFPYNISSQIIFKMIDNAERVPVMVGMFQKELAERICAKPGSKANGVITLLAQAYYEAEILLAIGPDSFDPAPRVESAVITLRRKEPFGPACNASLFKSVIKQAFQQRRKKMRNTLKSFPLDLEESIFQKRPEELGVEDFVNIVNSIKKE